MSSTTAAPPRTTVRAKRRSQPHVEIFWSTRTGRMILVGCHCELGYGHTYREGIVDRLVLKADREAHTAVTPD